MIFTKKDYENLKMLKEKVGTWKETDNLLGISHRTSSRMRSRFREGAEQYNLKADYAEEMEQKLSNVVDLEKEELEYIEPERVETSKGGRKYQVEKGILSLNFKDYTYYDDEKESWVAGKYSNIETGKEISKTKSRQIRAASLEQIRKMNKAKQFLNQKNVNSVQAYNKANEWNKKYNQHKKQIKNIAYKDKNGRWRWGKNGVGVNGRFAKVSEVKQVFKNKFGIDPTDSTKTFNELIALYTDKTYLLKPSP
jgi:hypothetical protein